MNLKLLNVRNNLLNNVYDSNMSNIIKDTILSLEADNPFATIIQQALEYALEDIQKQKFTEAGYQVNFIHNMPISKDNIDSWDESHFYEYELPVYFEHVEGTERIKKMILLLSLLQSKT